MGTVVCVLLDGGTQLGKSPPVQSKGEFHQGVQRNYQGMGWIWPDSICGLSHRQKQDKEGQGAWGAKEQKWRRNVGNGNKTPPNLVKSFYLVLKGVVRRRHFAHTFHSWLFAAAGPRKAARGLAQPEPAACGLQPSPSTSASFCRHLGDIHGSPSHICTTQKTPVWRWSEAQLLIMQRKNFVGPVPCKSLNWSQSSTLPYPCLLPTENVCDLFEFYLKLFSCLRSLKALIKIISLNITMAPGKRRSWKIFSNNSKKSLCNTTYHIYLKIAHAWRSTI